MIFDEPDQPEKTISLLYANRLKGTSKNSNFFVRARKHRPESRSLRGVNEDSRTELTPLSRKKCIFRDALNNDLAAKVITGESNISSKEEAENLTYFFWAMVDEAADDEENDIAIEGYSDLQSWLEKAMHIFSGYIKKHGFAEQWREISRKCS